MALPEESSPDAPSREDRPHPAGSLRERADLPMNGEVTAKKKEPFFYGGQAVIEGVMMRGRRHYAVAVRVPSTLQIVVDRGELNAPIYVNPFWKQPFVRGLALIGEQMHLGMKALM